MFSIKLTSGKVLQLARDARISVVLSCPLFDRDRIMRSFSYPFGVPMSDANRVALGHIERFDTAKAWDTEGAAMWIGGGEYEKGELVCTGSGPQEMEVGFRSLPVTVLDDLKKIYINEILETVDIDPTGSDAEVRLTITAPPFAYDITIAAITYTLGVGGSSGMSTSDVGVYFRDLINADFPGMASSTTTHLVLDAAMVTTHTVDWSVMTGFTIDTYVTPGQSVQESFLNHVQDTITTPADTHVFSMMDWQGLYEGKNKLYEGTVNPVFDGVALSNAPDEDETLFEWTYIPFVRLSYILTRIRDSVPALAYVAGWLVDNTDAQAMIVVNNQTCDRSYRDWYADELFKWVNGFVDAIDLNRHVPRMTAHAFLASICDGLNLIMEYRDGGLHFRKSVDLVTAPPEVWDAHVEPAKYDRTLKTPEGVTLMYPKYDKEGFSYPGQLTDYVLDDGGRRREMPFRSLYMSNGFVYDRGTFRCPHTNQPGRSPIFGGNASDMPLYLLFDRGLGETSLTETYPFATHDEYEHDGTTVAGGLSLALNGARGLVAKMYGDTLGYSDLHEMSIAVVLPESELYRLRKWENARVRFYHPNGSVVMVLRSVEFEVDGQNEGGWVRGRAKGVIQ